MAYATLTDMENLYGVTEVTRCSDWDLSGSLNVANVNACLSAASDEMDSYLAVRYSLPLASVTDDLVRRCVEIGMYKMCPYATTLTDYKTQRYKDAVQWLLRLSRGEVTLGPMQNNEVPAVETQIQFVHGRGDALTFSSMRRIL